MLSYKTAKALQEAGLPRPEPAIGQFWYNNTFGELFIINAIDGYAATLTCVGKWGRETEHVNWISVNFTFAPTVTDILMVLGEKYDLVVSSDGHSQVTMRDDDDQQRTWHFGDTPEIATSNAFLNIDTRVLS